MTWQKTCPENALKSRQKNKGKDGKKKRKMRGRGEGASRHDIGVGFEERRHFLPDNKESSSVANTKKFERVEKKLRKGE